MSTNADSELNKSLNNSLDKSPHKVAKNLCAHTMPLYGIHLIEASAGTGKTYNITRLYLRLLLERRLTVEQILVMTFTKDATEELRGRIDASIRDAINNWHYLIENDQYFIAISQNVNSDEALQILKTALLYLDEAAIFTIHGFCKRVLTQHAFATGMAFNAQMESDCQDLILEACQDWYRYLVKTDTEQFQLLAEFWSTPEQFLNQFSRAIAHTAPLQTLSPQTVIDSFKEEVSQAKASLVSEQDFIFTHLIDTKKEAERQKRIDEYQALLAWLDEVLINIDHANTAMPVSFFNGNRFSKSVHKEQFKLIFLGVNTLKKAKEKIAQQIVKAHAYVVVKAGVTSIRAAIVNKKLQQNMLSFDDLISSLARALLTNDGEQSDPQQNDLALRLFEQFPVALVDEFQDTDPQQFDILKAIYYAQKQRALYLIGDPKQAIYGFRGGDVFAYLNARDGCDQQWLMDTNWRSSQQMISAYNRLFWGNALTQQATDVFGYNIPYNQVKASPNASEEQLLANNDNDLKALQFVHLNPMDPKTGEMSTKATLQSFRPKMASWCAQEIDRLLKINSSSTSQQNANEVSNEKHNEKNCVKKYDQSINAKDIAILVRDGSEAAEIKAALNVQGLKSVYLSERENLLKTAQASQLVAVLQGILFVENERLFTAAIASPLLGLTPVSFNKLQQDQHAWQQLKFSFVELRNQWQSKSFISMALVLLHQHFVIVSEQKDRVLTNLIHLFELLQAASQRHHQGQELLFWLEQQVEMDNPDGETELRLESDEALIKIVTQHGSKGLEYPVVFVPFVTRHKDPLKFGNQSVTLLSYHDQQGQLQLSLDGTQAAKDTMQAEGYAETVRLLYVAVTRAKQRCYLLTTGFTEAENSPLGRTLKWKKGVDIPSCLQRLSIENPANIGFLNINEDELEIANVLTVDENINYQQYNAASFNGKIERDWWLSSFSALNKNLHHRGISSPDRDNDSETNLAVANSAPSHLLRFNLAKGAHTGNLLHDILEHTDFCAPNWPQIIAKPLSHYADLANTQHDDLIAWLDEILQTPLHSSLSILGDSEGSDNSSTIEHNSSSLTLSSLQISQTLRETEFYFPMHKALPVKLANILTAHRQAYHTLVNKNSKLSANTVAAVHLPHYQKLNGMMHGFIDLVFCHQGKYYLCDYKSSHLGNNFSDYQQASLVENIEQNHYDLQYLIYSLALHRYLQQRLPNYNIEQHFGGVYYLYLRGMSKESQQTQSGVFYRKITSQELTALDQLFSANTVDKNIEDNVNQTATNDLESSNDD